MPTEVAPGILWLRLSGVNAYVVDTDEGPVLVDAGTPLDDGAIVEELDEAGFGVPDLRAVLLTHHDPDHVGGLAPLVDGVDVPVHMHRLDAAAYRGEAPLPATRWKGLLQRVGGVFVPDPDFEVEELRDGDAVAGIETLHTPGHTPGHVAFLHRDPPVVLVGDLAWAPFGRLRLMPGIMDDDPDLSTASLGSLVHRIPEVDAVLPGHGRPVTEDAHASLARLADGG